MSDLEPALPIQPPKPKPWNNIRTILYILGTLVLFVFALDLMVSSLQHLGKTTAETIIVATSNPFTGLFIGLLITAMIQSSSTTTAMVVALVASGSITIESAIPIIMGANVGTTITSTIVSMGFINKKKDFRRAVSAGTYDGFFNILTVIILFPLQYYYGFLSNISLWVADYFFHPSTVPVEASFTTRWTLFGRAVDFLLTLIPSGFLMALLSFILLFTSILLFRKLISGLLLASSPERFSRFFFKNSWKSFFWGIVTTAAIRSSTITISVVVPIVAQKIVSLRKAVPFILGANIGTTITAFIAALLNVNASTAISIAISHFLFNLIGLLIFYPIPLLRRIPFEFANRLGRLTIKYRLAGFVYILLTFFFIPFSLIFLNKDSVEVIEVSYQKKNLITNSQSEYRIVSKSQAWNKNGEWLIYNTSSPEPSLILPVYKKNDILFINKEMYLFNKAGFCWDEEGTQGKYRTCIQEVLPSLQLNAALSFDSVYVYTQQFYNQTDSMITRVYMSKEYPVILKKERVQKERIIETEEVTSFSKN
ncbi:MAG TPA: Na/Pi symporter [Cyclobacteriaceae bacterium]|nr:Na/Pi symporter [Cyclobacteriaceae bacterium]